MSFIMKKSAYRVKHSTHTKNYISKMNRLPFGSFFFYYVFYFGTWYDIIKNERIDSGWYDDLLEKDI